MKKANMKKGYSKLLLMLIICMLIAIIIPIMKYASTSESVVPISHSVNKLLTAVGISNPHQDTFTAYMDESCKKIDSSIANYRTYYGIDEKLHIKVTFTSDIQDTEDVYLYFQFGDGPERQQNGCTISKDYIDFQYTIQDGDKGGLKFKNLSGKVQNSEGYAIEIALPNDANIYENTIIADTTHEEVKLNSTNTEEIYTIKNNTICPLKIEDIKLVTQDGFIKTATDSDVTLSDNNRKIQIKDANIKTVCINAVDIAGNPLQAHVNTDGTTATIEPLACVVDGGGNLVTSHAYKAGDTIRIKAFIGENSELIVKFDGNLANNTITKSGDIYQYIVHESDSGMLTIDVKDKCNCEQIITNVKQFKNINADTTAPSVEKYGVAVKSTKDLTDIINENGQKESLHKLELYPRYRTDRIDDETTQTYPVYLEEGTIYIKENIAPRLLYTFNEEVNSATFNTKVKLIKQDGSQEIFQNHVTGHLRKGENVRDKELECGFLYGETDTWKDDYESDSTEDLNGSVKDGEQVEYRWELVGFQDLAGNDGLASNGKICSETNPIINEKVKVIIDKKGPDIKPELTERLGNGWLRYKLISDSGCGIDTSTVTKENVKVSNANYEIVFDDNNDVYLQIMPYLDTIKIQVKEGVIKDKLGNANKVELDAVINVNANVDTTAPVINDITGIPTNWIQKTTLSVIASDTGSSVDELEYKFELDDTKQEFSQSNTFEVTQNGTVKITVKDKAGNETTRSIVIDKIDKTPPTIDGVDVVQKNGVTEVTIKAYDNESGICKYTFDGGVTWQTSPTKEYTDKQTIVVGAIQVMDNAGNNSQWMATTDVVVQYRKPTITISNNGGTFVKPTDAGKAKIPVNIVASSEVDCDIYYTVSTQDTKEPLGSEFTKADSKNSLEAILELAPGTYYLWTYARIYNSGTSQLTNSEMYTSNKFEVIESSILFNQTKESNGDKKVNITYGEGLTENRYAGFGDKREAGLTSVIASENGTVYAEATDKAGNKVYNSLEITDIDKKAPIISIQASQQGKEIKAQVDIEEENLHFVEYMWTRNESGASWPGWNYKSEFTNNKATITKSITESDEGTWYLFVKAMDKAGNTTTTKSDEIIISFDITYDTTSPGTCIEEIKTLDGITYIVVSQGTTRDDLLKYVTSAYDITIKSPDKSTTIEGASNLATNQIIEVARKTKAIIAVKGDVTSDGVVNLSDILKLNLFRLGKLDPTYAEFLAGNVVRVDNEINFQDILKLNQYRLNKISNL